MAEADQRPIRSGFDHRSTAREVLAGVDLRGRNYIVTGGYSGIGLETVGALAEAGASVTVPARSPYQHVRPWACSEAGADRLWALSEAMIAEA